MLIVQISLTTFILILFFIKFRIGVCIYLAYFFLVPYCKLNIGGITFSWNLINAVLFVAYCIDCNKKIGGIKFAYKPFVPFMLLYVLLILEIPFQDGVPINYAMNGWRLAIFNLVLPIVLYSSSQYDKRLIKYVFFTMVCVSVIIIVYAFSIISLDGLNPYVMEMAIANGAEIMENQFGEQTSRLMIKISSVFTHPMTFGLFLGLVTVYMFSQINRYNRIFLIGVILALISCIFISGIRTPIAALFITIAAYLLLNRRVKILFYSLLIGIVAYYIIIQIPALSFTILSIIDKDSSDVGGSSLDMRLEQFEAAIHEVRYNPLFGKGFSYTDYYWETYGSHPKLLSFESLIYVILCNYGIIGFIIWGLMFYKTYKYSQTVALKTTSTYILLLMTYYISYACITGEYGYIKYFMLFYSLTLIGLQSKTTKEHKQYEENR